MREGPQQAERQEGKCGLHQRFEQSPGFLPRSLSWKQCSQKRRKISRNPSKQITKMNGNPTLLHVRALCLSIITPSLTMQCRRYYDYIHFKEEETALQLHPRSWIGQDPQRNQFPGATIGGRQGQLPWTTFWERSCTLLAHPGALSVSNGRATGRKLRTGHHWCQGS